jgi:uncharacterized protein YjbI with pentapeptide repeats
VVLDADARGASFKGAKLANTGLSRTFFGGGHFEGADLTSAYLEGSYLGGSHMKGADLSYVHAADADFSDADLTGTRFTLADFKRADLTKAVLVDTHFSLTNMRDARLDETDVSGSDIFRRRHPLLIDQHARRAPRRDGCERIRHLPPAAITRATEEAPGAPDRCANK